MAAALALIDCNNFYASCEQLFDPALQGQPVVVLSNNDGCIVARSREARQLGIAMGTPYFQVADRLRDQQVVVRSSNYALYGDMSQRVMALLKQQVPELEVYSIDEAFARLPSLPADELSRWAAELRVVVRQQLGLPIALGMAPRRCWPSWPIAWPSGIPPARAFAICCWSPSCPIAWRRWPLRISGVLVAAWRAGAVYAACPQRWIWRRLIPP